MRETIIKCDLCLSDITTEDYIPRIRVKVKPKGGWRMDQTPCSYPNGSLELCAKCENTVFDKIMSMKVPGANIRVFKEKEKDDDQKTNTVRFKAGECRYSRTVEKSNRSWYCGNGAG